MTKSNKPSASDFEIDTLTFPINSSAEFFSLNIGEDKVQNWPMVYVLNNKQEAYIGQTNSVTKRMSQHKTSEDKKALNKLNIIYHPTFNSSAVTDFESKIIQFMYADGVFKILNRNEGLKNANYYSKDTYENLFTSLWSLLQERGLAKSTLDELEQSAIFKFSPYKELNADQERALESILRSIEKNAGNPILIEGEPGTGKTILGIYLLLRLKNNPKFKNKNIKIVIPQTGLRRTIQETFKHSKTLSSNDVISPYDLVKESCGFKKGEKSYDILIVDEAHRLNVRQNIVNYASYDKVNRILGLEKGSPQVDWILNQAEIPIFMFDSLQKVGPAGTSRNLIEERISSRIVEHHTLESQMRIAAGNDYLNYIQNILNGENPSFRDFQNYQLKLFNSFQVFNKEFISTQKKHALTRMIAGYAWPWISKKDRGAQDIIIEGVKKRWNTEYSDWISKGFTDYKYVDEIGCIHTSQGYDLSYAFVILGNDIRFNQQTQQIEIDRESYFDRNGKNNASDEELEQYIRNIYYVLLTRGVFGTYIYACDPCMREYLSRFIPTAG